MARPWPRRHPPALHRTTRFGAMGIRPIATAVSAAGLIVIWITFTRWGGNPSDAWAYWSAAHRPELYRSAEYAYVYSPAALQLALPLLALPFDAFLAILRASELAALFALAGPAASIAIWLPPVAAEINAANINLLLMACAVAGMRWPVLWVFPLLTKPSMAVALLWFAVRGEWARLVQPVAVGGLIALLSFLLAPQLWWDWIAFLATFGDTPGWPFPISVWPRLPIAVALVVWGARTGRRWTVPLAAIIALPRLYFLSISMLVGLLPLMRRSDSAVWPRS